MKCRQPRARTVRAVVELPPGTAAAAWRAAALWTGAEPQAGYTRGLSRHSTLGILIEGPPTPNAKASLEAFVLQPHSDHCLGGIAVHFYAALPVAEVAAAVADAASRRLRCFLASND